MTARSRGRGTRKSLTTASEYDSYNLFLLNQNIPEDHLNKSKLNTSMELKMLSDVEQKSYNFEVNKQSESESVDVKIIEDETNQKM